MKKGPSPSVLRFAAVVVCQFYLLTHNISAQSPDSPREHLRMDQSWRFAFGHPFDVKKDFNTGTGYFSYIAKAGYGDGAASTRFDDRGWRVLDLPHDWAAEAPFDGRASHSHGYKAIGLNFPERSVGWYRKTFTIPASDAGRRISIVFDGVSRNAKVWINGFYLGTQSSGYASFQYDISEYLDYGKENVIAVRADVTEEEGWFYEGAGIYRHVWLDKTNLVHVVSDGTFITSRVDTDHAYVTVRTSVTNDGLTDENVLISQTITDDKGNVVQASNGIQRTLSAFQSVDVTDSLLMKNPTVWSLENPYLYTLTTTLKTASVVKDIYKTTFGVRTIRFDPDKGFFLNGKRVELKGTNNHQDHAGVGTAMPDALQDYRITTLKSIGCNAYRCSHNPPTPELLNACDRLGMLVIDENRLMGTSPETTDQLKRMILRDRNHPSIILWSVGNEEWAIEGNDKGAVIANKMQAFVKTLDTTRPVTAAISGGWGHGISTVIEVMGFNYIAHGSTDEQHAKYPKQSGVGTEEGSTYATRGVYEDDKSRQYIAAYDRKARPEGHSIEEGWSHYASRDYLAGMFIWTGFDYRGESTPYGFPSVYSYFGMLDACGFPKDDVYYLQSWWTSKPVLHILPHWNWNGKEGKEIDVWVYSNCEEVELFLNKKSLGKKSMKINSHLEWEVNYESGTLEAVGFKNHQKVLTHSVKTTGKPESIYLSADRAIIRADREDISLVTVQLNDSKGLRIPDAGDEILFTVEGPGKIIGVGNGDQTSHEADRFVENIKTISLDELKQQTIKISGNDAALSADYDDSSWSSAFKGIDKPTDDQVVFRGNFSIPDDFKNATTRLFYSSIGVNQALYVNGNQLTGSWNETSTRGEFLIDNKFLKPGKNVLAIVGVPLKKKHEWDEVNQNPGSFQMIFAAPAWKRKLFSGLAQVIIQATDEPGDIILKATTTNENLKPAVLKIKSNSSFIRPIVSDKK